MGNFSASAVCAGAYHTLILSTNATVYAFGRNIVRFFTI
jgi:alpha-tubulin suppressor-like RCC1 family protein